MRSVPRKLPCCGTPNARRRAGYYNHFGSVHGGFSEASCMPSWTMDDGRWTIDKDQRSLLPIVPQSGAAHSRDGLTGACPPDMIASTMGFVGAMTAVTSRKHANIWTGRSRAGVARAE